MIDALLGLLLFHVAAPVTVAEGEIALDLQSLGDSAPAPGNTSVPSQAEQEVEQAASRLGICIGGKFSSFAAQEESADAIATALLQACSSELQDTKGAIARLSGESQSDQFLRDIREELVTQIRNLRSADSPGASN